MADVTTRVRRATPSEERAVVAISLSLVEDGTTYVFDETTTEDDLRRYWFPAGATNTLRMPSSPDTTQLFASNHRI